MIDREFTVSVHGLPNHITDIDIKTELATSISRLARAKGVFNGFSVGTTGGILHPEKGLDGKNKK